MQQTGKWIPCLKALRIYWRNQYVWAKNAIFLAPYLPGDHTLAAVLRGCSGGSWIFSTRFQGQSTFIIILRHYLLFCCTDVYIDSAKALARKTVGSLVQIKAVTWNCPRSHCIFHCYVLTVGRWGSQFYLRTFLKIFLMMSRLLLRAFLVAQ